MAEQKNDLTEVGGTTASYEFLKPPPRKVQIPFGDNTRALSFDPGSVGGSADPQVFIDAAEKVKAENLESPRSFGDTVARLDAVLNEALGMAKKDEDIDGFTVEPMAPVEAGEKGEQPHA